MKRFVKLLALLLIPILSLSACSGANSGNLSVKTDSYSGIVSSNKAADEAYYSDSAMNNEVDYSYSEKAASEKSSGSTDTPFVRESSEKLVYTCSMTMETLHFEECLAAVQQLIGEYGGFIESEEQTDSSYGWYYEDYRKTSGTLSEYLVIRIPTENYDAFLADVKGNGKVTSKSQNVQNITTVYNDTQITIDSLKAQEERLLSMMKTANSIDEMLSIESRLTSVQTDLAIYESRLKGYDLDVTYSTITLRIKEVLEYTIDDEIEKQNTFWDRLKSTLKASGKLFTGFAEGLLFFLIKAVPIILALCVLVFPVVLLIRRAVIRKRNRRNVAAGNTEQIAE